jgi:hypothetical protein
MNKSEYMAYLASREWALLKNQVRERSGGKCERCKSENYEETHHLTYERIGNELPEDLIGLCQSCHRYLSGKLDYDPATEYQVFAFRLSQGKLEILKAYLNSIVVGYNENHPCGDFAYHLAELSPTLKGFINWIEENNLWTKPDRTNNG